MKYIMLFNNLNLWAGFPMKKKILILMLTIFVMSLFANITTIGTGTLTNVALPIEPYYGYSYSQCIYLQTEIDRDLQRIEKIWYNYNQNGTLAGSQDWVIYMGHTADVAFATTSSWVPLANLTEVFNGTLPTIPADGWIEFVLTTTFVYNNTDNLVIAVAENMGGLEYHCLGFRYQQL